MTILGYKNKREGNVTTSPELEYQNKLEPEPQWVWPGRTEAAEEIKPKAEGDVGRIS